MNRADLIASLPELKKEYASLNSRIAQEIIERDALASVINGIERLAAGDSATVQLNISVESGDGGHLRDSGREARHEVVQEQPAPRGVEAIRRVLSDGRAWKLQAIIAEVQRRGWIKANSRDPANAIRESVRKLASMGEIERIDHATYRAVLQELPVSGAENGSREPASSIGVQT